MHSRLQPHAPEAVQAWVAIVVHCRSEERAELVEGAEHVPQQREAQEVLQREERVRRVQRIVERVARLALWKGLLAWCEYRHSTRGVRPQEKTVCTEGATLGKEGPTPP